MIETLLIIEDEKLLGSELSRHYRQSGWEVVLAINLAEARELLLDKKIEPLLILSDMNLSDGNALDFMEKMKGEIGNTDDSKDGGGTTPGKGEVEQRREQLPTTARMQEVEQRKEQLPTTARMQEVEQCKEQLPRAMPRAIADDCTDAGGRAMQGAVAESNAWSDCRVAVLDRLRQCAGFGSGATSGRL